MTDCPNPDAERAALAEALEKVKAWCDQHKEDYDAMPAIDFKPMPKMIDKVLANLSPAAKEILEKAQAHDRQAKLIRLLLPDSLLREMVEEWPTRAQREAAADELQRRAALAGEEPE